MADHIYCYEDTDILKNKFDIRDAEELENAERKFTSRRITQLGKSPIKGKFDLSHLQAIHKYIFQDVYEWAGELRVLEISKGNYFCSCMQIPAYADSIFSELKENQYLQGLPYETFIEKLSRLFADINALHPFREGNGRTQREFIRLLIEYNGYSVDFSKVTQEEMVEASIQSFYQKHELMEELFRKCIK